MNTNQQGFIALTSAIIISFLLIAIMAGLGFSASFARFNVLDLESKQQSNALAKSCVDIARIQIVKDASYAPQNVSLVVGSDRCTIISIETLGSQKIIKTQAVINRAYTNLEVTIDNNFLITSFKEVPNFVP